MVPMNTMVNESYEPSDREEAVLEHLKDGRDRGEPWGAVLAFSDTVKSGNLQVLRYAYAALFGAGQHRQRNAVRHAQ